MTSVGKNSVELEYIWVKTYHIADRLHCCQRISLLPKVFVMLNVSDPFDTANVI